jgi:hypothetical protein
MLPVPVLVGAVVLSALRPAVHTQILGDLFSAWERAGRDTRSLVVEHSRQEVDRLTRRTVEYNGTFRLLRTPDGRVMASYGGWRQGQAATDPHDTALLNAGVVYLLFPDTKGALKFEPAGGDPAGFLERHFHPLVVLLDRKRAVADYDFRIVKRDEYYTYLTMRPKPSRVKGVPPLLDDGLVVTPNADGGAAPKGMPVVLRYTHGPATTTSRVKSWRANQPGGPRPEEFAAPTERDGWKVKTLPQALSEYRDSLKGGK